MKKITFIIIFLLTSIICFNSCNKACVCTVSWVEYHHVGGTGNYYTREEYQTDYVLYLEDETSCKKQLAREYGIEGRFYPNVEASIEINEGIKAIECFEQ